MIVRKNNVKDITIFRWIIGKEREKHSLCGRPNVVGIIVIALRKVGLMISVYFAWTRYCPRNGTILTCVPTKLRGIWQFGFEARRECTSSRAKSQPPKKRQYRRYNPELFINYFILVETSSRSQLSQSVTNFVLDFVLSLLDWRKNRLLSRAFHAVLSRYYFWALKTCDLLID